MRPAHLIYLLFLLFFFSLLTPVYAFEVVSEHEIVSINGGPVEEHLTFTNSGLSNFVLKVTNGNPDSSQRISSATIYLNDSKIIGPSDLNQKVSTIERVITPLETENTLVISLRSNPGGFLKVQVLAEPTFSLPPDPGSAGDLTLEGIDANGNGIRDDVERWIYLTHPESEKMRMALIQKYYPLQDMIILGNREDRDAIYDNAERIGRASECFVYLFPEKAYDISNEFVSVIVNTSERTYAYLKANKILGGGTFSGKHPSRWKSSCQFDVDSMSD